MNPPNAPVADPAALEDELSLRDFSYFELGEWRRTYWEIWSLTEFDVLQMRALSGRDSTR